jgi:hypothetical protein
MAMLQLQQSDLAQWYCLINDAEYAQKVQISQDIELYLVHTLMAYTRRADLCKTIIGLEFLKTQLPSPRQRTQLQEIGDHCLLFDGLFHDNIKQSGVHEHYYRNMGEHAYQQLYFLGGDAVFLHIASQFVQATQVLQGVRKLAQS